MPNNNSGNLLSNLTTKQKATGAVVVILVAVVVWQIVGLFGGDSGTPPAPQVMSQAAKPPVTNLAANPPAANNSPANLSSNMAPDSAQPLAPLTADTSVQQRVANNEASTTVTDQMIKEQEKDQVGYLKSLNKLQNLKLEREIAESSQAIAASKLATAKTEKDMSDLLTKSTAQVSLSDYASKLAAGTANGQIMDSAGVLVPAPPSAAEEKAAAEKAAGTLAIEAKYVVLSVSKQLETWKAVIGDSGKLYSVSVGDTLPGTKITVNAIDNDGVTLLLDKKKQVIHILTSI